MFQTTNQLFHEIITLSWRLANIEIFVIMLIINIHIIYIYIRSLSLVLVKQCHKPPMTGNGLYHL